MEMYNNKFVVAILQNGNFLKELENGSVPIPFGSEYTIRLRNKHNRRAVCKLYIDGENVSGGGFIVGANSHVDIERPVDVSRKFKFVSLDSDEAYDHGKNGPNYDKVKGVIRAEFALEKEYKAPTYASICIPTVPYKPYRTPYWCDNTRYGAIGSSSLKRSKNLDDRVCLDSYEGNYEEKSRGLSLTCSSLNTQSASNSTASYSASMDSMGAAMFCSSSLGVAPLQDGATVEGSYSSQNFNTVYFDNEDNWTTVKLFLQGYNIEEVKQITLQKEVKKFEHPKDKELAALEKELLALQKEKMKKEIEKLKNELTV